LLLVLIEYYYYQSAYPLLSITIIGQYIPQVSTLTLLLSEFHGVLGRALGNDTTGT
jgi:hypothetical protein